jgi:catechol-2,3-dioxygenase
LNITSLELSAKELEAQRDFYANILELPVNLDSSVLDVKVGETDLRFSQAPTEFDGAYHFAFDIPENQFDSAKKWISGRISLLSDENGQDEFESNNWNSHSVYFKDAAGNVLEFIARHNLDNAVDRDFDSGQILNISEIGLPSENVIEFANELCTSLNLSVFRQEPNDTFTPVGDDHGLFILPIKDRIWIPNSGVPARMLPVRVTGHTNGQQWEVRGVPYKILF